jgi:Tfp pilus assembly protein FimT
MLLVLGLLVAIAALAMPSATRPLESYRLRKSGDLIRAEWAKARASAMETGRTYVFRYEPEADGYHVEPWYSDEDYLESSTLTGIGGAGAPVAAPTPQLFDQAAPMTMKHLPEEIVFVASETTQDARELLAVQGTDALQNQDASMSSPIFFYPDGTSSTANLLIQNPRGRYIKLTLRGLTGVVYVSDPLSSEQVE